MPAVRLNMPLLSWITPKSCRTLTTMSTSVGGNSSCRQCSHTPLSRPRLAIPYILSCAQAAERMGARAYQGEVDPHPLCCSHVSAQLPAIFLEHLSTMVAVSDYSINATQCKRIRLLPRPFIAFSRSSHRLLSCTQVLFENFRQVSVPPPQGPDESHSSRAAGGGMQ